MCYHDKANAFIIFLIFIPKVGTAENDTAEAPAILRDVSKNSG
jgi:hypothetical protein